MEKEGEKEGGNENEKEEERGGGSYPPQDSWANNVLGSKLSLEQEKQVWKISVQATFSVKNTKFESAFANVSLIMPYINQKSPKEPSSQQCRPQYSL